MSMNERQIIEFEKGWEFMQKGITKLKNILEGLPEPPISSEDYMMLYETIYNMCTQKPPHDYSQQLYDKYREVFEEYITSTVLPSLREKHDEFMLRELVRRWANHKVMVRWLSRFFHYLDRYFVARKSLPALNVVGLTCFRDLVYVEINGKVKDAVITIIDQEREGDQIDRALLKNVLDIFVEIGMEELDYYGNDFEAEMLKVTAAYYSRKASNWIMEDSFPDYMLKAEECLNKERDRVSHYLHLSSEPKLVKIVQNELLEVFANQLLEKENSERRALHRDDKVEDLSRMFRLYLEGKNFSISVAEIFKQHVTTDGIALVQQAEEAVANQAARALSIKIGKRPRDLLNPKAVKYMQSVFSIKDAISKKESWEISALFGVTVTQVKLMEWILQMQNSSVLYWFLTKGGVMILATWLSQAAVEEQTSVLFVILKVLCHLPLHKALPVHMSAILQSVNRLRFYRTSDISNRARVLLSRWSKIFARSQAMKKPNGMKSSSDAQKDIMLKQSISEIMSDESWQSKIDTPEEILASSYEGSENFRKLEPAQSLKLLPASTDDSSRRHIRGVSSSQTRERRKVLLVEQPGQKTASRSQQVARAVSASQGRPMSADDIQKAKLRAQFMQSKYGKTGPSSNENHEVKTEGPNKPLTNQASLLLPASKVLVRPEIEEHKKPATLPLKISDRVEASLHPKPSLDPKEPLWVKCKRVQIPWQTPPEMRINSVWRIGDGANSKEVEVQRNRIRREKETIYQTVQDIPPNPKDPWDIEMDYDDTLTPEIPTEQPPEADNAESQISPREYENRAAVTSAATSSQIGTGTAAPEPDLELLAVLLKNPELVFALTSGQGGNLSSEETVRLLDMIKANGVGLLDNLNGGLLDNLNGFNGKAEERVEVSLPSPTPSTDPGTSGWRPEVVKNPFSRQSSMAYASAGVTATAAATPASEKLLATTMVHPQMQTIAPPQQPASIPQLSQQFHAAMPTFSMPQTTTFLPENRHPSMVPSLHQNSQTNPILHSPTPEAAISMKNLPANVSATAANFKPAPVSITFNTPDRSPISFPLPPLLPTPTQPQQPYIAELPHPSPPYSGPVSESWRSRQGLASNPRFQANQNNYNAGGPVQHQPTMLSGPPWDTNEYVGGEDFETWSPEGSPNRSPEYRSSGWNVSEPRMNFGRNYRPDRSRPRNSSGNRDHRDYNRHGNRRWRERDRERERERRR